MIERYKKEIEYYYKRLSNKEKAYKHAERYILDCYRQGVINEYETTVLNIYNGKLFVNDFYF